MEDIVAHPRHNSLIFGTNDDEVNNKKGVKWKCLFGLFLIQFFLYQLILCYGVYTVYLVKESVSIIDTAWAPLIFITCFKVTSPWFRDIVESYGDYMFRRMLTVAVLSCSVGISINFFSSSLIFRGFFYGAIGGVSTSFVRALVQCRILDIFQHKNILVTSIENFGIAFGMFLTPHLIHFLFDYFENSAYVFLIHGVILLNCLPAGLLLGTNQAPRPQYLSKYKSFSFAEEFGEELVVMSNTDNNKNWKNPSDNESNSSENSQNTEYAIRQNEENSPNLQQAENSGINILPLIPEEDEDESDDDLNVFDKQVFASKIKRLSTISSKLEELISKNEEQTHKKSSDNEIVLNVNKHCDNDTKSEAIILEFESTDHLSPSCCTPYQKYRFRRRFKSFVLTLHDSLITPLFLSLRVLEFYPCLLLSIHSLMNPLIFLLYMNFKNDRVTDITPTEISFLFSIISFSYLCFLVTLPWIILIPKKNLKYLFVFGSMISAIGVMIFLRTSLQNYVTLSCLIYGFGFGIEYYSRDLVMINFLGVKDFSKVEGTLESLSGVLFLTLVSLINEFVVYANINKWFEIIFYSHIIMCCVWTIIPPLMYIYRSMKRNYEIYEIAPDS